MTEKILHGMELPICVGYGTEANLEDTAGKAWLGELALSTDTALLFTCPADGDPMIPVVEQWRASETTDTEPDDDTTPKRLTLQYLPGGAPSNAYAINFLLPGGGASDFYLVLEEAA